MTRRAWVLVLVALLTVAGALHAAASSKVGGDFLRYHRAGRMVTTGDADRIYDVEHLRGQHVYAAERAAERAEHGDAGEHFREEEFKYAPALAVLLAPLGALSPRTAWIVWGGWNGALVALTFLAAWDFAARGAPWRWMLIPLVLLARSANDNVNLGQLNPSAIAPATVALWALDRGRDRAAGALAALGTVVKFIPAGLALWFAWKRRWTALAVWLAATVVLGLGLPAAVLGPGRTVDIHRSWLDARAHVYADAASSDLPGHSIKSFVYRLFGGVHYQTGTGAKRIDLDVSVAHADPVVLQRVVLALSVALLAAVLWRARGALRAREDVRGPPEAALFVGFLLLASPEARAPHFLYLALPFAALTYALVRAWIDRAPRRVAATVFAGVAALLVNTDSETLLGRDLANRCEAYCTLGWATLAAMAAIGCLTPSSRGTPGPRGSTPRDSSAGR